MKNINTFTDVPWKSKQVSQLVASFVSLGNTVEAENFLRDLLTKEEIMEFARRLETARLLYNDTQYNTIIDKTGLSSTTIARISKYLKGPLGGYRSTLNKLGYFPASLTNGVHHHPSVKLVKGLS